MLENYRTDSLGVIEQINREPFNYGYDYSANYNKLAEAGRNMAYLRLGYLLSSVPEIKTLLDVGYGNADFITAAHKIIPKCYASDISSEYPLPEGVEFVNTNVIGEREYDVVTLFDVLEHFEEKFDLFKIKAKYFYISLPYCNYKNDTWFKNWKHRKPNEHIWFFNKESLKAFMNFGGYEEVISGHPEDTLRKDSENTPNILSAIYKRK